MRPCFHRSPRAADEQPFLIAAPAAQANPTNPPTHQRPNRSIQERRVTAAVASFSSSSGGFRDGVRAGEDFRETDGDLAADDLSLCGGWGCMGTPNVKSDGDREGAACVRQEPTSTQRDTAGN